MLLSFLKKTVPSIYYSFSVTSVFRYIICVQTNIWPIYTGTFARRHLETAASALLGLQDYNPTCSRLKADSERCCALGSVYPVLSQHLHLAFVTINETWNERRGNETVILYLNNCQSESNSNDYDDVLFNQIFYQRKTGLIKQTNNNAFSDILTSYFFIWLTRYIVTKGHQKELNYFFYFQLHLILVLKRNLH